MADVYPTGIYPNTPFLLGRRAMVRWNPDTAKRLNPTDVVLERPNDVTWNDWILTSCAAAEVRDVVISSSQQFVRTTTRIYGAHGFMLNHRIPKQVTIELEVPYHKDDTTFQWNNGVTTVAADTFPVYLYKKWYNNADTSLVFLEEDQGVVNGLYGNFWVDITKTEGLRQAQIMQVRLVTSDVIGIREDVDIDLDPLNP